MATFRGGNMNNRNDLLGGRAGYGAQNQSYSEQTRSLFEEENNRQTAIFQENVARMKELALQINGEVTSQNEFLDGLGQTFGQTGQLMSGALSKLKKMIDTGGSKHMCYLIMFIVGLFLFLYLFLLRH